MISDVVEEGCQEVLGGVALTDPGGDGSSIEATDYKDEDFLAPVLEDPALRSLLNLYDQICNNSHRPFRYPPTDACQKLKDVLSVIDFFDDDEDMDDVDELRDILAHYHMRALLQVL